MDKRKKRTSINQYLMYIELLEKDTIFRTGTAPRDAEPNYINNQWRDLAGKLNTCPNGPQLSPEEWKKRLNDWKNSTRCKYRRSISGERDISMSPLEVKALSLFGKTPVLLRSAQTLEFKSEAKALYEAEKKHQEAAKAKDHKRNENHQSLDEEIEGIFIEDEDFNDAESVEEIELTETKLQQQIEPTTNSTPKLKRRRTVETAIYEIKTISPKSAIATTTQSALTVSAAAAAAAASTSVPSAGSAADSSNNIATATDQPSQAPVSTGTMPLQSQITIDTSALEFQLKRLADIKAAKLKFEIAKYKYNNPGFEYSTDAL